MSGPLGSGLLQSWLSTHHLVPFLRSAARLLNAVKVHIHLEPPSLRTRTSFGLDLRLFLTAIEVPPALTESRTSEGDRVRPGWDLGTTALTGALGCLQDSSKGLLRPIFFRHLD